MTTQSAQAIDDQLRRLLYHDITDSTISTSVERIRDQLAARAGIEIYCYQHRGNHVLTPLEVEMVIHGLVAQLHDVDEDTMAQREADGTDPTTRVYEWCALEDLGWIDDGETYAEHLEAALECRQRASTITRGAND